MSINFKDVNDTLGHSAGDELLVQLAQRLRAQIQPGDMLGRLGGDEFVIVLPNRDADEASLIASRITEALAAPLQIGTKQVPMSASIGISMYPDNATDIDTLIQQADAAMYKAKQAGRSTFRFFSADMDRLAEQRLAHSAALRRAHRRAMRCNCTISRRSAPSTAPSMASRRWRAGMTRCSARSRRQNSSRWPKSAD